MDDEAAQQRQREIIERVEKSGRDRYGTEWPEMVSALGRAGLANGVAQIIATPDAVDRIERTAREVLLNEMASDDKGLSRNAERVYNTLRNADRKRHREARGRA